MFKFQSDLVFPKAAVNHLRLVIFTALTIFLLSGCQQAGPADSNGGQDLFLGIIGFLLFLGALAFAGYRAFNPPDKGSTKKDKAEFRARAAAFVIGILVTIIIIAVDTESAGFLSVRRFFGLTTWYIFVVLGGGLGFLIAMASYVISNYRVTTGYEFVILTVTICGALGIYLSIYGGGLRHNILAGLLSILVGLLLFRMLFPIRPEAKPAEEE